MENFERPMFRSSNASLFHRQNGMEMLVNLSRPDGHGRWLLPSLEAIVLDSVRNSILTTLTGIVANRLTDSRRVPVARIRSVTLPGFLKRYKDTLQEVYLSTLNLLVAEVKVTESR